MSTQTSNLPELKKALETEGIQKRFSEMLGKKSAGFLSSITNVVHNNELLKRAEINSIILAAAQAAALDLPINQNLGYAAIIPFNDKKNNKCVAQFQIMINGYVELAMRSGQFQKLTCNEVYEGELVSKNRFTDEYVFDETKRKSDNIVGFMAYMKLNNGFEKTIYWTAEECKKHGMKYSQTFKMGFGLWKTDFIAMAKKTVLKNLLVKYAPKSVEMFSAIESDQATFNGSIENPNAVYIDSTEQEVAEEFVVADVVECDTPKENKSANKDENIEF